MPLPIIVAGAVTAITIGRKVQKVSKVLGVIQRTWPALSQTASKSIPAIARVLNRMSVLLGEQRNASAIWNAARTAIDESVRVNPQFISQVLGSSMSKESAMSFFAKLFELLL